MLWLLALEVIMEENLKAPSLHPFAMIKELSKSSQHPRHLSRMELWKERTELFKKWPESCWITKAWQSHFGGEVVNTACLTLKRVYFRPNTKKTPYELWRGKKPVVKYFRIFGSDCYILRDRENLENFDAKSDKRIFLGYSTSSKAYRVYNLKNKIVMESTNVVINDEQCTKDNFEMIQSI